MAVERIELEVFSQDSNVAIVRMPGRRFPGVVIQGDSLFNLAELAESLHRKLQQSTDDELADEAAELAAMLQARLSHYESVLTEHHIELPYFRKVS